MSDEPVKRRFFNPKVDFNNPQEKSKWMMDLSAMLDDLVGAANPAWTTPAMVSGDFYASGTMTWTNVVANVLNFQYAIVGKMMYINFYANLTTIGGTMSNAILIKIPASMVIAKKTLNHGWQYIDGSGTGSAFALANAGATIIEIWKQGEVNWVASSGARVAGQIFFEIQ